MRLEHWFYSVPLRLRSLFRRQRVEQDLDDELQDHLHRKTEEYIAQGMTPDESRRAALRAMDGLTQRKEECRDARRVNPIENTLQDIRYALRVLAKAPGFTAIAVFTLALAIGANAVVFGVLNGLILRPLNVPHAESLYGLEHGDERNMWESYPDYLDLRDRNRTFDGLAGFSITMAGLDTGEGPSRSWGDVVTGNYFDVLGIRPYLGRFFHGSDEHGPNSAPYLVLSYGYWHNHLSDDRSVVGRVVRLNKHSFTVIGIAPPGFNGTLLFAPPDFYAPFIDEEQIEGENVLNVRKTQTLFMTLGHLKAGVTPQQAAADLNSIGAYLEKTYPNDHGAVTFTLARPGLYGNLIGGPLRAFVTGLMLLAGLILLAACANLGSLFAARAADRSREIALRLALGAARNRILRQFLTEAALISLAGGVLGLWGSVALLSGLSAWNPFPRYAQFSVPVKPDANVYAAALILALVSGLLFGIVPLRQVLRANPYQIVKAGPSGTVGRRITLRDLLLAAQIAICAVLVTSSMVAVRGLARSLHSNFGFDPRGATMVDTDLAIGGYRGESVAEMQKRMIEAAAAIPGVESVGLIGRAPLTGGGFSALIFNGQTADLRPSSAVANALRFNISPEYLHAARTVLIAGRPFSWHDDKNAPRVAIVNREFAAKVFGSTAKALGGLFQLRDGTRMQVVGVVEDGKYMTLTENPTPALFLPVLQAPISETWLVVRSNGEQRRLATAIQSALRVLDAGLPYYFETWSQQMELVLFPSRMAAVALGVLGFMGAVLSISGIFGMAAYSVSKRLRELGIRMALGARRQEVLRAALGRPLKLLALGSGAGLILGILAGRVLASIVYQATPRDPLVLAGVVVAMLLLGLLATWIPAQRALSLDPVTLLREE